MYDERCDATTVRVDERVGDRDCRDRADAISSQAFTVPAVVMSTGARGRTLAVWAHRLLASLHPHDDAPEPEIDADWRAEIGSRVDRILNGEIELGSFESTRAKARALLDDLRA